MVKRISDNRIRFGNMILDKTEKGEIIYRGLAETEEEERKPRFASSVIIYEGRRESFDPGQKIPSNFGSMYMGFFEICDNYLFFQLDHFR